MNPLLDCYRKLARILDSILQELEGELTPGRTTRALEQTAEDAILRAGVKSCFAGFHGFPSCITASINEEVLNTVPSKRELKTGDLLKLQVGITDGIGFSYQAWTYFIGPADKKDVLFVDTGRIALAGGVAQARTGGKVQSISGAIQNPVEAAGYSVNRSYVGHGMGGRQHEVPQVPCYVPDPEIGNVSLAAGQILSILVIAHQGRAACRTGKDGWNVVTGDRSRALLLSQIVVAGKEGPEILLEPRNSTPSSR